MATLATQNISLAGLADALAAAAGGGDAFTPDKETFLRVNNASGGAITVTVVTPGTIRGIAEADPQISVPAGQSRMFGPFPPELFGDPANAGLASITYSGVTSLTIGAFKLAQY